MKKLFYFSVIILLYVSCHDNNNKIVKTTFEDTQATVGKNFTGNNATVYLTAQNTDKRLALDSENQFTNANQPLETEIAVFVNPEKKFQEFLGIGGAITDASAEVFSKLTEDKQQIKLCSSSVCKVISLQIFVIETSRLFFL